MPSYRQADAEDTELLDAVMNEYHPRLAEHGVTVGLLYAFAAVDKKTGLPKGPALVHHGEVALALIKINSHEDRVQGKPDATIKLDHLRWREMPLEQKRATLDHELEHLVLVDDPEGGVALDDCNRPRMKNRPHDYYTGGFWNVVDRHGKDAVESLAYREIHREFSQRAFPWG